MGRTLKPKSRSAERRPLQTLPAAAIALFCLTLGSASAAVASELPPLRTVGSFGGWTLYCKPSPATMSDCALAQAVQSSSGDKTKLVMSISFDEKWDLAAKIRVEPSLVRTEGIALLVDGIQLGVIDPSSCDLTGCTASFVPTSSMLARIFPGRELEAEFRAESSTTGTSIGLDLPGLSDGLAAMRKNVPPPQTDGVLVALGEEETSQFTVELVDLSSPSLPKGRIIQSQNFIQAARVGSPLIQCNKEDGSTTAEQRPGSLSISLNARLEVINYTDASGLTLSRLADITRRCGGEYFVAMTRSSDKPTGVFSLKLSQVQEAAVRNLLTDHGINKLVIPDEGSGLLVYQAPNGMEDLAGAKKAMSPSNDK
jgi:invasion protein IalB